MTIGIHKYTIRYILRTILLALQIEQRARKIRFLSDWSEHKEQSISFVHFRKQLKKIMGNRSKLAESHRVLFFTGWLIVELIERIFGRGLTGRQVMAYVTRTDTTGRLSNLILPRKQVGIPQRRFNNTQTMQNEEYCASLNHSLGVLHSVMKMETALRQLCHLADCDGEEIRHPYCNCDEKICGCIQFGIAELTYAIEKMRAEQPQLVALVPFFQATVDTHFRTQVRHSHSR